MPVPADTVKLADIERVLAIGIALAFPVSFICHLCSHFLDNGYSVGTYERQTDHNGINAILAPVHFTSTTQLQSVLVS